MRLDDYTFETDSITEYSIEDAICCYCRLSYADKSYFTPTPSMNTISRATIYKSDEGSVSCSISINKGTEKLYSVKIYAIDFTKGRSLRRR